MTLSEIMIKFRVLSGRYNLVDSSGNDKATSTSPGGLYFVQSAQRWLDRKVKLRQGQQIVEVALSTGDTSFTTSLFTRLEASLPLKNSDGKYLKNVERLDYETFRKEYASQGTDDTSQGQPANYCIKPGPTTSALTILIAPACDDSYTLELIGDLRFSELTDGSDENAWSVLFPDALILASLYQLEVYYRNTEGQQDWLSALIPILADIDRDQASMEDPGYTELAG